jgi:hypothetical protein
MFQYVENIMGFSKEAFFEAYNQGVASKDESSEMNLTIKTYERVKELESQDHTVEMIMVGLEKTIILYGGGKYEIILIS